MKRLRGEAVTLAGALVGLAAGALAARLIRLPVSPDQLAGLAKTRGFNPRQDVLWFALLGLGALAGAGLARYLSRNPPAGLLLFRSLPIWLKLALAACVALAAMAFFQRVPLRWQFPVAWSGWLALGAAAPLAKGTASERRIGLAAAAAHALTLWLFLAAPAAKAGISSLSLGALLLAFSIFEGYWLGNRSLERGAPNLALAALAFPVAFWSGRSDAACVETAVLAALLPLAGPAVAAINGQVRAFLRALTVTVFLPGSIAALGAAACLHTPPMGNFFEDGHGLLPASEYLRGELPYKDIVPGHGLIADGVLQAVELRVFGDDYRGLSRGAKVVGAFFWPLVYAVGVAATASPAFGFWGAGLSFLAFPQFMFFRVMASLVCLALAARAARTGRSGAWLAAGAALPIAMLFALEFSFYAGAAAAAALVVSRGRRLANARRFLAGALLSAVAVGAVFAVLRILRDFLYDTFVFIPRLFPAYALGTPPAPASLGSHLQGLEAFTSLVDRDALYYWFLIVALVVTSSLLVRAPAVSSRGRALLPLLVWFCAGTLSVIERHHFGYPLFVAQIALLLLARWLKGYRSWASARGWLAVAVLLIAIFAQRPGGFLPSVVFGLANSQPPAGVAALSEPPRARGVLFPREETVVIATTGVFLQSGLLAPDETWLDFANASLLYYLFNRDCPIRYYEVAFYEAPSAQEEVIAAIARNKRVKAVLIRTGLNTDWVDGVPNDQRAPLVFQYILKEFQPAFKENGVEFWTRKP